MTSFSIPQVPLTDLKKMATSLSCHSCARSFDDNLDKTVFKCPDCLAFLCNNCDIFIHETLHTCPGCASKGGHAAAGVGNGM